MALGSQHRSKRRDWDIHFCVCVWKERTVQATFIPAGHLQSSRRGIIIGLSYSNRISLEINSWMFSTPKGKKTASPKLVHKILSLFFFFFFCLCPFFRFTNSKHTNTQSERTFHLHEAGPHPAGSEPALNPDGGLVFLMSVFLSLASGHKHM